MFKLSLHLEGAGYLEATVVVGNLTKTFIASELGSNLCSELVHTAIRLKDTTGNCVYSIVEMYGEPDGLTLYFTVEEGRLIIRLYYTEDFDSIRKEQYGECLVKIESSPDEVIKTIYWTLRSFLVTHGIEAISTKWQEFPLGAFLALHRELAYEPILNNTGLGAEAQFLSSLSKDRIA